MLNPDFETLTVHELIRTSLDADGVLLATIDMPGRSMNVFSAELMDALDALMDRVDADAAVRAVVLTSGKSSFLAGADLVMVRGFTVQAKVLDEAALFALCGRLGRQFVRLEASAKPWVAAVNGIALGGGLELAMACRARLVVDSPKVQLGLPEVRWGLLPGAGGTQRLARLAGFEAGVELLLSGRSMEPEEAVARRVFDAAVPADQLLAQARALALSMCGQAYDPARKFRHLAQADVPAHSPARARELALAHGVSAQDFADYPAFGVIADCVLMGARLPLAEATAVEMTQFLRLMVDPVAGHMVRSLFLNRQRADRALAAPEGTQLERLARGPLSPGVQGWDQALARSRLPLSVSPELPADTLVLTDTRGQVAQVRLACLGPAGELPAQGAQVTALLSAEGPYGRVLEILVDDPASAGVAPSLLAALAPCLGALPYPVPQAKSALATLRDAPGTGQGRLDAQALLALDLWQRGAMPQVEWADVASCVAGVTPPWTGGPFAHLWSARERLVPCLDGTLRQAWQGLAPQLQEACA